MDYVILLIIVFISNFIAYWLQNYVAKKASNRADKEDSKEINYEIEKGKNLATKEDVEDITRKVEDVKNLVSFTAQKRFDHLNEQERILTEILQVATQISQSQNKLILYLYDTTTRNRYDLLVDFINERLEHFYHLSNLAIITINEEGLEDIIKRLSMSTTYLGLEVCTLATNAANLVSQYNNEMDYVLNRVLTEEEKLKWLENTINTKSRIENIKQTTIRGKNELQEAINDYCLWLKQLYDKDFFVIL